MPRHGEGMEPEPEAAAGGSGLSGVALERWAAGMERMHTGIRMLFMNQFEESEAAFLRGIQEEPSASDRAPGEHDLRGAYALQYALTSVIKGVASMEDDQLDECRERLLQADQLASESDAWVGQAVVRGICTLQVGFVQILQRSYMKGVFNVLRSWTWVKRLKSEALDFIGPEREVVRSVSLLTLGAFNIILSLLPPSLAKAGSWVSGFDGDRQGGLDMIRACWEEDGLTAPWAAITWLLFTLDTKTLLNEPQTAEDFATCQEILEWADKKYPRSIFFKMAESDLAACRLDMARAAVLNEEIEANLGGLRAMKWVVLYKKGVFNLINAQWTAAGESFRESLSVYVEAGRRSMVPFMGMYTALCFETALEHLAASDEAGSAGVAESLRTQAKEMWDLIAAHGAMDKSNWGKQDFVGFRMRAKYHIASDAAAPPKAGSSTVSDAYAEGAAEGAAAVKASSQPPAEWRPWALLDLAMAMISQMRCTRWIPDEQTDALLALLDAGAAQRGADQRCTVAALGAEVSGFRPTPSRTRRALAYCETGLALQPSLSEQGRHSGAITMLLYVKATLLSQPHGAHGFCDVVAAQDLVTVAEQANSKGNRNEKLMVFKIANLKKVLTTSFSSGFETVKMNAGGTHEAAYELGGAAGEPPSLIVWEAAVTKFDVDFSVRFDPAGGGGPVELLPKQRIAVNMCKGEWAPTGPGVLRLMWDNSFSYLRGKTVTFRLTPPLSEQVS